MLWGPWLEFFTGLPWFSVSTSGVFTEPLWQRPQAPERPKTFPRSPDVASVLLGLSAHVRPDGGDESHQGKRGILGMPGGPLGTVMVAFLWERPRVWHVSALAALPPTGGAFAAFVFSWRVCEVLNTSHSPDHERYSGICSSGHRVYCYAVTVAGYRATIGHGTWMSCDRQAPEFLT